jgi:uncharacterized protein
LANLTTRRGFMRLMSAFGAALIARRSPARTSDDYDLHLTSDVMVRMRDGVHLATDIYRPMRDGAPLPGRFPVILERTPYGKTVVSRSELSLKEPTAKSRAEVAR